jgi:hypothetical protein
VVVVVGTFPILNPISMSTYKENLQHFATRDVLKTWNTTVAICRRN